MESGSAGKDLELIMGGRSVGVWCATGKTSQRLCQIAYRTLDDPAVSQTLFPRLARKYDFKIRILHILKYLTSGLLEEKFLLKPILL